MLNRPSGLEAPAALKASIVPDPVDVEEERLTMVLDIPVRVSVEIGRRRMILADVLRLGPGSIVELGKASGEALDIRANGQLIAKGEAVVVGDRYGVRVMDVVATKDRWTSLMHEEEL